MPSTAPVVMRIADLLSLSTLLACGAQATAMPSSDLARPPPAARAVVESAPSRTTTEAAASTATGLRPGDAFVDFGLPRLNLETGQLEGLVWLSDQIGTAPGQNPQKIVLLNFFAAWCAPCFEEFRTLDEWQ